MPDADFKFGKVFCIHNQTVQETGGQATLNNRDPRYLAYMTKLGLNIWITIRRGPPELYIKKKRIGLYLVDMFCV